MANVRIPRPWALPDSAATPHDAYLNRRALIRALGLGAASVAATRALSACGLSVEGYSESGDTQTVTGLGSYLPGTRNAAYAVPERALTAEEAARTYNNYYEFTTSKQGVWRVVGDFEVEPWTVEIAGLCHNPGILSFDDLLRMFPIEERVYRFRCVERWAMTVPWNGFPLASLIAHADPMGSARYVLFTSVDRPEQQPGRENRPNDPWPYHEALRLDEAQNELGLLVVGLYGNPLPTQNGAPLRLIVPWKYGYKNPKAIVRIEFVEEQPPTFWNTINPTEYGFYSNVDPAVPHPRWSQQYDYLIPSREQVPTLPYNGYADQVASMYVPGDR